MAIERRMGLKSSLGAAMAYVMITALLMGALAAMLLRAIFGGHLIVNQAIALTQSDYWLKSCLSLKTNAWLKTACAGNPSQKNCPCAGNPSDSCDFTASGGPIVSVACSGPGGSNLRLYVR